MSDRGHIIVAEQHQIEVYPDDTGYVIIKQSGGMEPESIIFIDPTHSEKVADAILKAGILAKQFRQEWIEGDDDESA